MIRNNNEKLSQLKERHISEVSNRIHYGEVQQSVVLKPDTTAPDFTLHSTPDQLVSLNQFRGNPTVLAFYPADFSPVCGDQMTL